MNSHHNYTIVVVYMIKDLKSPKDMCMQFI